MSEDEAKTKWCPFARVIGGTATPEGARIDNGAPGPFNRVSAAEVMTTPHSAKCLGSACMAWRWSEAQAAAEKRVPGALALVVLGGEAESEQVRREGAAIRAGFCGLAGPVL